jgi:hypothetical protein
MTDRSCRGGERPAWPPHRSALPGGQPAVMETCARRQVLRDWQSWPPRPSGAPPDPGEPGPRAAWCSHARTRAAARSACVRPCAAACGGRVASAACSSTRPPAGRPRIRCGGHSQKQAVAVAGDRVVQHRDGATGGVLQHKIANHADADDRQHKKQCSHGHLRRSRWPGQSRRVPRDQNGKSRIRRTRRWHAILKRAPGPVIPRWAGNCGMLPPPAPETANHGEGRRVRLVPAWGETDAWTNRYHEHPSHGKQAAGTRAEPAASKSNQATRPSKQGGSTNPAERLDVSGGWR